MFDRNPSTVARAITLYTVIGAACSGIFAAPPASGPAKAPAAAQVLRGYGQVPLSFEANQGQSGPEVRFLSRGNGYSLFLTDRAAVIALTKTEKPVPGLSPIGRRGALGAVARSTPRPAKAAKTDVVRMELAGASHGLRVTGAEQLPGTANYFIGSDPSKWHSNVPTYSKVKYTGVYPGVDLVYYGNQRQLEYDFVVAPGADAKSVRLHFSGVDKLRLDGNGDLQVIAKNGEIAFHKPVVYQMKDGQRETVEGRFTLLANHSIGFTVPRYDRSRELVIDPTLAYSTYLGGSSSGATAIAVDSSGDAYITGYGSPDFPITAGAYQTKPGYIFITKLNSTGTALVYSTFLGATAEYPTIAVDTGGNAYVTGFALSGFPVTAGAYQTVDRAAALGAENAFVTKLNPTGTALIYSTYLGGSGLGPFGDLPAAGDGAHGIAVDAAGDAYVAGYASSTDFPVTGDAYQTVNRPAASGVPHTAGFISKLNPAGTALVYSTFLSGSNGIDAVTGIAVDPAGAAYVVGGPGSTDFPVTSGAFQQANYLSVFVTKLNPSGSALTYSTFFGGAYAEATAIAVDAAGDAYIAGKACGGDQGPGDIPVTSGAFQTVDKGVCNAFVTKFNPSGSALIYSTYLGGSGPIDVPYGIAVNATGAAFVTGLAESTDFPVTPDAFQKVNRGADVSAYNAFITKLFPTGSGLTYSTYLGGTGYGMTGGDMGYGDSGSAIAVDPSGNAYVAGIAATPDFPVTPGAFQTVNHGFQCERCIVNDNAVIARFQFAPAAPTTTTVVSDGNPQKVGVKVTFTAHVVPAAGSAAPVGTVGFSIDGGAAVQVALDDTGHAAYATSALAVGVHKIIANYIGDFGHLASASSPLTETIYPAAATIAVVSGTPQTALYGSAFARTLVVVVKDSAGNVVPGAIITFSGTGLKFSQASITTGANGQASVAARAEEATSLTATATASGVATPVTFALTATKAQLTVTATSATVGYNKPVPALTYTLSGFVNGDPASVVIGTPTETTTAKAGSPVGSYPIAITQGTLEAANYSFKFVGGTLKVVSLIFSPASAGFGSVAVGAAGPIVTITVTNYTSSPARYLNSSGLGGFNFEPGTCGQIATGTMLAAGASCDFKASFSPKKAGAARGSLTITTAGGPTTFTLTGTGVAAH